MRRLATKKKRGGRGAQYNLAEKCRIQVVNFYAYRDRLLVHDIERIGSRIYSAARWAFYAFETQALRVHATERMFI